MFYVRNKNIMNKTYFDIMLLCLLKMKMGQ